MAWANLVDKNEITHGSNLIQIKNNQNHILTKNCFKILLISLPGLFCIAHVHLKPNNHNATILHELAFYAKSLCAEAGSRLILFQDKKIHFHRDLGLDPALKSP